MTKLNSTSKPKARTKNLIVRDLDDETLVYDLERHRATCLNEFAARVWRSCDGRRSISELAATLEVPDVDDQTILLTLDKLAEANLLEQSSNEPPHFIAGETRRDMMRRLQVLRQQPKDFWLELRARWPDPVRATVSVNGLFDAKPRWPLQLRSFVRAAFSLLTRTLSHPRQIT